MSQDFRSNTAALEQRIDANRSARYDLEEWIFSQTTIRRKMHVLDLGCGTGKQMFALHSLLSPQSRIVGVDISPDAVSQINRRARHEKATNVTAVQCGLDQVIDHFQGTRFDLILSTYAIYYSHNMAKLMASLTCLMNPNAQLFICGYGKGTNQEIYDFIDELPISLSKKPTASDDFISKGQIEDISHHYVSCREARLPNKVIFTSSGALLNWWMNHNSYIPEIHQAVHRGLDHFFQENEVFSLSKNVLGFYFEA